MSVQFTLISKWLENFGFEPELIKGEGQSFSDMLKISMGLDKRGRERFMMISAPALELKDACDVELQAQKEIEKCKQLQVRVRLPFQVPLEHYGSVSRIIVYLNNGLDVSGFGFDEVTGNVYFCYCFIQPNGVIDQRAVIGLLGMIMLYVDNFSEEIEAVANGEKMSEVIQRSFAESLTALKN